MQSDHPLSVVFGLDGEPFEETVEAALGLYGLAAVEAYDLFDARQRSVVDHALKLASAAER